MRKVIDEANSIHSENYQLKQEVNNEQISHTADDMH